jgi:biopolymer transport protein ExbD
VQFRRTSAPQAAINIAPLVDVVFLLVIFFAVSTTFLETAGLKLELPSSSSTAKREPQVLTVVLAADGTLSYEGETLDRKQLAGRLEADLDSNEGRRVELRADRSALHGDVVAVMDVIHDAGADSMKIAAQSAGSE